MGHQGSRSMKALVEAVGRLTALRDRDALDRSLVETLAQLCLASRVAVHRIVGDAGDEHWFTSACVADGATVRQLDPAWLDLRDLPALGSLPDWAQCAREASDLFPSVGGADQPAITLFPLLSDAGALGVVELCTAKPPGPALRATVHGLLTMFRNLQSLLDYSECDTLTGLLNRKSFDETFYKASARPLSLVADAATERRQLGTMRYWLGVIDIDHFKQVNDQHGHLIGDEVLLLLSRTMRRSFRFLDKLYRFGGEEFVVLMRCSCEEHAQCALERLRQNVAEHVFPRVAHVTVSVGFTDVRVGDTPPAAIERADLAVYYAKHHGRNQVRSHAVLVREGELTDASQSSDIELF